MKTFTQLCCDSGRVCNMLAEQGVQRGETVIVILPRLIEWWTINIACLRMGVVISPGEVRGEVVKAFVVLKHRFSLLSKPS